MDNGPISASAPSTSLTTATGTDITFNTRYPFSKLDSTNTVSFELITLFLAVDTPNPDGVTNITNSTLVYSFPHGYPYVPSTWFLLSLDDFQTVDGSEGYFLVGGGDIPEIGSAYFVAQADDQNINFYINKIWASSLGSPAPTVLGLFITIRSYVFVNDLLGTDVPTQP